MNEKQGGNDAPTTAIGKKLCNPTCFDQDGTCSGDMLLQILNDSLLSLFFHLCPRHVLKQRLLPACFHDGVAKGFRKAIQGCHVTDGNMDFPLPFSRFVFGSAILIDKLLETRHD